MNYYPHHIGDFNNATRHLTRLERGIYRDMIELYYDTEAPLTKDINALCRKIIATGDVERTAVEQVLNEYFTEVEQGWSHERCDEEIAKYQQNISSKKKAGKASAESRANKQTSQSRTAVEQVCNECSTNQNQEPEPEPITNTKAKSKATATASRLPADWHPSEIDIQFCKTTRPELISSTVADEFRDYWIAQPGAKGRKLDWPATWRNWVRNQRRQPGAPPLTNTKQAARDSYAAQAAEAREQENGNRTERDITGQAERIA